jgi:hypothetical protein
MAAGFLDFLRDLLGPRESFNGPDQNAAMSMFGSELLSDKQKDEWEKTITGAGLGGHEDGGYGIYNRSAEDQRGYLGANKFGQMKTDLNDWLDQDGALGGSRRDGLKGAFAEDREKDAKKEPRMPMDPGAITEGAAMEALKPLPTSSAPMTTPEAIRAKREEEEKKQQAYKSSVGGGINGPLGQYWG